MIDELKKKRVLFFGGKGGVGKTTLSSSFAFHMSEEGRRVLLVSTDPAHNLSDILDRKIGDKVCEITKNFHALEIDTHKEAHRYINSVKEVVKKVVRADLHKTLLAQLDSTIHSPGASEAALMDRLSQVIEDGLEKYDMIVFDTAPTGHTVRLMTLPESMKIWMDGLIENRRRNDKARELWAPDLNDRSDPIRDRLETRRARFAMLRDIILDKDISSFVFVTRPASIPVSETVRAIKELSEYNIPIAGVFVNGVLPAALINLEVSEFVKNQIDQQNKYIARIRREIKGFPLMFVNLLDHDPVGLECLREIWSH